ncbi:MAG: hypothetical protein MI974_18470 [Chitinophagales bacterium]|nr:hypothetical protein [Chitinophagales bacterium]
MKIALFQKLQFLNLHYGAINSDHVEKHKKEVNKIEELYGIVPIYGAKEHFAIEKTRLRKEGNLIPDFDLLIGCSAIANNMIMVTRNTKHLSRIKDLQIENWTDPLHNNFL